MLGAHILEPNPLRRHTLLDIADQILIDHSGIWPSCVAVTLVNARHVLSQECAPQTFIPRVLLLLLHLLRLLLLLPLLPLLLP